MTWTRLLLTLTLLLTPVAYSQTGGGYDLSWSTLEPGTTSTGGSYRLTGVIGQPDAASSSGGSYTLSGGFLVFYDPASAAVSPADWTLYDQ